MSHAAEQARPVKLSEAPAHKALRIWLEADKSRTYAGMARVLGMSAGSISQWCRTTDPNRPADIATMFAIAVLTGIPVHAWLSQEENAWLRAMSHGEFTLLFERLKRTEPVDARQMNFDGYWRPNAPQAAPFDPDADMVISPGPPDSGITGDEDGWG